LGASGSASSITLTGRGTIRTDDFANDTNVISLEGTTVSFNASALTLAATKWTITQNSTAGGTISTGLGDDTITGGAGNDSINGGAGVDSLNGGAGNDSIVGGVGADVVVASLNNDTFTLGDGADVVRINTIATSAAAAGAQVHRITDFVAGTDKINFAQGALALTGVTTDGTGDAVAAMAAAVTVATSVATIADVYTALATSAAALTASAAAGTATVAQVYVFSTGAAAGTYLVVNDATLGFQAATDVVINITGVTGTVSASDFTFAV
jgi:Ca2+-binding RTX toxin-like protein